MMREVPDAQRGNAIMSADRPSLMVFVADEASEAAIRGGIGNCAGARCAPPSRRLKRKVRRGS